MTVNNADSETPGERLPLGYGRIRRGPMAADAFTQIRNAVFRDTRLSAKAMGIFGNISTHRDGWGVSAESISAQMKDGVASVKAGLRELQEYGYLHRTQTRKSDGTLGGAVYFITDQPEAMPQQPEPPALPETCTSEPSADFRPTAATSGDAQNRRSEPSVDSPPAVEPPAVNRTHKNTNSKHPKSQNTLSPPEPQQTAGRDEREINPLIQKLMDDHDATEDEAAAVVAQVQAEGRVGSLIGWACSTTGRLDAKQRLYALRHSSDAPSAISSGLPPWCGQCGDGNPAAEHNPKFRLVAGAPCPACHPDAIKEAAA